MSGAPSIKVHSTIDTEFPLVQSIDGAHALGCHHIVTDASGSRAVSVGFDGTLKVWYCVEGYWSADDAITGTEQTSMLMRRDPISANQQPTGSLVGVHPWAIALSGDGQYLAGVTENGRVGVWDLGEGGTQIRDHETKGSFGTCIDLVGFLPHRKALAQLIFLVCRWPLHCQWP